MDNSNLKPFILNNGKKNPFVLVVPGGGYDHYGSREQDIIAQKMNELGFSSAVLYYRINPSTFPMPLVDLAQAMAFIKCKKSHWNISSVCVMGFSAGGHLSACLGAWWNSPLLREITGLESEVMRPDYLCLCYPVVTSDKTYGHAGSFRMLTDGLLESDGHRFCKLTDSKDIMEVLSVEKHITKDFPPSFVWHTQTDESVKIQNSLTLVNRLVEQGVSVEYHLFPEGKHGLSLAQGTACGVWPELFANWYNSKIKK